jgi:hypothetical protein
LSAAAATLERVTKRLSTTGPSSPVFQISLVAALFGLGAYFDQQAGFPPLPAAVVALDADLARERAAPEVQQVARWAVDTLDHAGLPFVVIDKARARVFAFDAQGRFRASAPILFGPERAQRVARSAPAGRLVADGWRSAQDGAIVWVHDRTVLSLQGIPPDTAPESTSQIPMSSAGVYHAVSYESLHVAADFYRDHLSALRLQGSIAYVLPEGLPWQELFGIIRPEDWQQITFAQPRAPSPRSPS